MRSLRSLSLLGLTLALLGVSGCALAPQTTALQRVHQAYEDDFATFSLPGPSETGGPAAPTPATAPAFVRSLQAIRDFRLQFPQAAPELAHLQVLEGMVYLQSGRLGLAEAVADNVVAAAGKLTSATGQTVRDQLLARDFRSLLVGWTEIREFNDNNSATIAEWRKLESAANALRDDLNRLTPQQLADPASDQGAVYVANTAAIFYVWAYKLRADEDLPAATEAKRQWFADAQKLIGRFLTEAEKSPAAAQEAGPVAPGRWRYVQWYHWLGAQP